MVRSEAAKASEKRRRKLRAAESIAMGLPVNPCEKRRRRLSPGAPSGYYGDDRSRMAPNIRHKAQVRQSLERGNIEDAVHHLAMAAADPRGNIESDILKEVLLKCAQKANLTGAAKVCQLMAALQQWPNLRTMVTAFSQVSQKCCAEDVLTLLVRPIVDVVDFGPQPDSRLEACRKYCRHFLPLLLQDFLEDATQSLARIAQAPPKALEDQGTAVLNVQFSHNSKPTQLEVFMGSMQYPFPFVKGDTVLVMPYAQNATVEDGVEAEVYSTGTRCALRTNSPVNLSASRSWRIDKMANRTSLIRQLEAVKKLVEVKEYARNSTYADPGIHDALLFAPLPHEVLTPADEKNKAYVAQCSAQPAGNARRRVCGVEELNASQRDAVAHALTQRISLIHGPPGTGKTYTSVALVKSWLGNNMGPVLATSDSNTAVDNLITGLSAAGLSVARIGRPEATRADLNQHTLEYLQSMYKGPPGDNYQVQQQILRRADVVCATCSGAGCEVLEKVPFFSVLIDEASQATEPSTLIPIIHGASQVALVGDHKQLPPTILSRTAELNGLGVSLFDRLVHAGLKPRLLDTQYRMHPALAEFSSIMVYQHKLLSGVTAADRPPVFGIPWPNPAAPLAFVPIDSAETSEGSSYLNRLEAEQLAATVRSLLQSSGLQPADIGIITPYSSQVKLIRKLLNLPRGGNRGRVFQHAEGEGSLGLEVNSVDGFQGREKQVILVSAVRANQHNSVGFLADPRRMNVMLTRAKRGLVVYGNPATLCKDVECWGPWLEFVAAKGYVSGTLSPAVMHELREQKLPKNLIAPFLVAAALSIAASGAVRISRPPAALVPNVSAGWPGPYQQQLMQPAASPFVQQPAAGLHVPQLQPHPQSGWGPSSGNSVAAPTGGQGYAGGAGASFGAACRWGHDPAAAVGGGGAALWKNGAGDHSSSSSGGPNGFGNGGGAAAPHGGGGRQGVYSAGMPASASWGRKGGAPQVWNAGGAAPPGRATNLADTTPGSSSSSSSC
eukprot:gene10227-15725_t